MTIQVPYRGIIEITSEHDIGKTIAALQTSNNMKDVVFVDDDVKGSGTVRQMHDADILFDDYIDLAPMRMKLGKSPTADQIMDEIVGPVIDKITSKKRKIIIWDTWRIVYQSARLHVERNQQKYSNVVKWQGNSMMIQGLISRVARGIELMYLNRLKEASELLIITHHVKDWYENNVKVGTIPESSSTFAEVCNMRIWLRRNQKSKVPIILFLKRPNVPQIVKGKLTFINVVPLKVTPTDKHESIWDAIEEYRNNPIQSRQPTADETPTPEELMAISGTLSAEMKSFVKTSIEYQLKIEKDLAEAMIKDDEPGNVIIADEKITESNIPQNGIQLLARAKADMGYELKDIERILGMSFGQINTSFQQKYWNTLKDVKDMEISEALSSKKTKKK